MRCIEERLAREAVKSAKIITGGSILYKPMPEAFRAIISFSLLNFVKAIMTPIILDMGIENKRRLGII